MDVLSRATEKLALDWPDEPRESRASKLDDRFLIGAHSKLERRKLPFFSDLHRKISSSWTQPFSSRLTNAAATDFTNLVGSVEQGYTAMPVIEDTLASHLSPSLAPSWKSHPLLPSKPCRTTSALIGKSYIAAGQAGMALHTMAILQAYQADVLKEMDEGTGLTPEAAKELRRATDLALRATKHTARAVGRSMAASVAAERHLWLNLTEIREKEKVFLMDAPISQSGLFGEAVSAVVDKFRSAKTQSAALKQFMPRRARDFSTPSSSVSREQPLPRREPPSGGAQATRPPPTTVLGARGRSSSRQQPRKRVNMKRPNKPAASLPDLRVGMRRVVSPLRGEARPQKRFCPPRTRSPHLNLSQPPFEAWCADPIHPLFHSGWQLGDAFVFPPLQPVHSPPASRMLGDTAVSLLQCTEPMPATRQPSTSLSVIPSKDAEGSPSRWRVPLLPGLLDTPSQVCLPLYDTMIPLSHFLHEWERLPGVSLWVLRTIRTGYTLQFGKNPPRFDGVHLTVVNSAAKASVLQQELSSLLQKGAIEEVPQSEVEQGFFSRYFLVPKRDGGLRPILDLRRLNLSLYKGKFKMLTMRTIMSQVQEGDWFVTIDLKDAYFYIQVVHRHRRFLRFAFGGKAYQYKVLPFGLALAPRTFTKCMDAALAPLRLQGIRVLNYLDDWLILAHSRELMSHHRDIVLGHIHSLGLRMNAKKSVLLPSQRTVFLGVRLDSVQMQARLAPARIPVFTACLARFKLGHQVSVGTCRRLLGLMAAASPVLPLGLLHMRPFLWWMKELRLHPTVPATRLVRVSRSCCRHLLMWRDPVFLWSGVRMGAIHRHHMITTDASMTGWGAVFEGRPASGEWKEEFLFWHINCLELRAVFLALKYFLPVLGENHVIVRTDNMAVGINRQRGSRSRTLDRFARHLLLWSQDKFLSWGRFTFREYWTWRPIFCRDRSSSRGNGCWTVRRYPRSGICLAKRRWTSLFLKSHPSARSGSPWISRRL